MKSVFAAVLTAGLLCLASSASAFDLLANLGLGGGYGCGCEPSCGPVQKGCCATPVQKDCGPVQKDCCHRDRCHRDRCHRGCLSGLFSGWGGCGCHKTCGCEPACGYDKGPIQK